MNRKSTPDTPPSDSSPSQLGALVWGFFMWTLGLGLAGVLSLALLVALALAMAYPQLPDISDLADYRPKLSMRVFSAEGTLIGEFGEERRNYTEFKDIPQVMKDAVLAIEDARFYQHGGVDYIGLARASLANLGRAKSQGASTITMQVARNVYLSSEKTFTRKIYELLLTFKLEHSLSKDQIFEIYLNQIFLGNRAYGFAAACEAYFDKPLKAITVAEAAMLAGLPKAPSAYNPISNPKRARSRQLYIIERMLDNGFITQAQADQAKGEELKVRNANQGFRKHADYVAEMARSLMFAQYGQDAYTRGLKVYTTVRATDQEAAYQALRRGIMDYEKRQHYRGPEKFIDLPSNARERDELIDDTLIEQGDKGDLLAAVVLEATPKLVRAVRQNGEVIEVTGEGLKPVQSGLADKSPPNIKLRPGAVIRIVKGSNWEITQLPEVEGAFVAMDPRDGAIRALVGGFDFDKNKFNHVTQAWRQPGSSFKPFIYSAALEKGFTPATVVNDSPLFYDASVTGSQAWEPKNYDGTFEGPMTLRKGLAKSKNMISIRVLEAVGPQNAQNWITQFGFDAQRHPAYLTMALGAGSVTPLQMATGYSVFANGGFRINPYLISKVTDALGKVLSDYTPIEQEESVRAISARNAFVMSSLLQEVTRSGTAAKAQATLKRNDIFGKTGTTNDSMDAWFAGYHPTLTAVTWIGYDTPRKLGDRETGGGLSLPVWIQYMQSALKNTPITEMIAPPGVVYEGGDWFFTEFARSSGISSLGLEGKSGNAELPSADEKKKILDLFKN
ncbi:MAG: PBP1A family penicillin-binding protein [Betaproteobacteria bacterium]|nr:PBP1A family penicillin-binding protein [Betaproteobacteria bacterium]